MSKEKLMMYSTMLDKKDIVDELRKQCEIFLANNSEDEGKRVGVWSMIYLMNESTNGDVKKMQEILNKWEENERVSDFVLTRKPTASA